MTIMVKFRLQCPHCGRQSTDSSTMSTNGADWRQRSDGYGQGAYYSPQTDLRACDCGGLFLARKHCVGEDDRAPFQLSRMPDEDAEQWRFRFEQELASWARRPNADDLERALAVGQFETAEFELELRLWLYWTANDAPGAADARDRIAASQDLPRLLTMVQAMAPPPVLLVGQILRDLGRFEEAAQLYESLAGNVVGRSQLIKLARRRRPELVWLDALPQPPG